jgi:hypothetical protein
VPLTFAHPVAVLPLRRWFLFVALAAGSMAPDILYFVLPTPYTFDRKYGHEFPGVILFSIPAAIILWGLWRWLVRDAVVALLPVSEQQKFMADIPAFDRRRVKDWTFLFLAVAIGIASHLLLDSFSHRDGWGTEHIGFLAATRVHLVNRDLALYKLVQYFGSLVGMGVLALAYAWWSWRAPRDRTFQPLWKPWLRVMWVAAICAISAYFGYRIARLYRPDETGSLIAGAIIGATRAGFLTLLALAIVVKVQRSRLNQNQDPSTRFARSG